MNQYSSVKQRSSRPLPSPLAKVSSEESAAIDHLTLRIMNFSPPPSTFTMQELLQYAVAKYPCVNSFAVHFQNSDSSPDTFFYANYGGTTSSHAFQLLSNDNSPTADDEKDKEAAMYQFTDISFLGFEVSQEIASSLSISFTNTKNIVQIIDCLTIGKQPFGQ